jgi:two-component system, chemotaxis family, protein-glutamate methylesterase/glutaminase
MNLRVLVVDDTAIFRKVISDCLLGVPGVEVIGTANTGKTALARIQSMRPDLVTLDVEMPEMNGLEVLEAVKQQGLDVGVVMLSAFTRRGSDLTVRALELGAFDFVTKSTEGSLEENKAAIQKALAPILQAFARQREIKSILRGKNAPVEMARPDAAKKPAGTVEPLGGMGDISRRMQQVARVFQAEMVLIGISTGGPNALTQMLPKLPADLGVPVFIVQHMPPLFTRSLADSLSKQCAIKVKEAENNEEAQPNTAYIAPGGKQMKIGAGTGGKILVQITDDPPENNCKPSADTLFRSAANAFPGRSCAVIMTGMGNDGTLGLRLIKRHPAWIIAQDEASCVVYGMPKEAVAAGVVDTVLPLGAIAGEIVKAVKRG